MNITEILDEKYEKIIEDFRDSILLSENGSYELREQTWDAYFNITAPFLNSYSQKWLTEFLALIKELLDSEKSCSEIPIKAIRSIKAYQIMNITASIHLMNLIDPEIYNNFIWSILKTLSPTDAANCRGYISIYNVSKNMQKDVARDITKQIVNKEFQNAIQNNEKVIAKIGELALCSSFIALFVLGLENEYLEKVESFTDRKSNDEETT